MELTSNLCPFEEPPGTGHLDNGTVRDKPITYGRDPTAQTRNVPSGAD